MSPLNLCNPHRTIRAGVILLNGVTELLDIAPIDFFHGIRKDFIVDMPEETIPSALREQALDVEFHWVTEKGTPARVTGGLTVQATDSFDTCPPLDIVLMGAHNLAYTPNPTELDFVRKSHEDCAAFLTICGGFQAVLMAGLLHGKTATAPKPALDILRKTAPDVDWLEKRWHRNGKIWTSGALLNGTDMMRAFATETWGKEGTLAAAMLDVGGFPDRDVDYN